MHMSAVMLLGGLVILAFAADRFVLAASRLSRLWGLSPVLVGALVVGMGTSAPELLVSTLAASDGELDLAIGNAVGSNVANVTLVLGVTALFSPLIGSARVLRREGVAMLAAVAGMAFVIYDLQVTRVEGIILLGSMVVAGTLIVRWARKDAAMGLTTAADRPPSDEDTAEPEVGEIDWRKEVGLGLLSLLATLAGAELLVVGGTGLAERIGVGSGFIGMTLVAVGTSLPELATSIAGIRRNENDLVVGNVLGSNLFNALAVAGMAAVISPGQLEARFQAGSLSMIACACLAGWFAFTGRKIVRWEGMLLFIGFIAFVLMSYTGGLEMR
ncbi:MAG: calcium/sodium antiporter [Deltaproteobacteria bacterium]|nr:calcium/sodium antiporter [Deltaproteobacteria bacterium]